MKRRSKAGGKTGKLRSRAASAPKRRRNAAKTVLRRRSASTLETEIARLRRELQEALEQQSSTSEVLQVISRSTFDLKPVLESLLERAVRLCDADRGLIYRQDGDVYRAAASYGHTAEWIETVVEQNPIRRDRSSATGRAVLERRFVHIHDVLADPEYRWGHDHRGAKEMHRTILAVPMLREDTIIGVIVIRRVRIQPFNDKQIALLESFAAQAVIAIENTRLLNELRQRTDDLTESLEQQTATSEVLKVISSSPGSLEPVFQIMLENAARLCEAKFGTLYFHEGDGFRAVAMHGAPAAYEKARLRALVQPGPSTGLGRVLQTKRAVQIRDVTAHPGYSERDPMRVSAVELGGVRTLLVVPMVKDDEVTGAIAIYRQEARPFTEKQIALVHNFAAQAVIAIENTRLLNELRQSLQQQTATADVLKVISSSPGELQPVFGAILENATRICDAKFGNLWLSEGDTFVIAATHGAPPEYREFLQTEPVVPDPEPESAMGRIARTLEVVQIEDITKQPAQGSTARMRFATIKLAKARTIVGVPMLGTMSW